MKTFTITIHDTMSWTISLSAPDENVAEQIAMQIWESPKRDDRFRWDDELTVTVVEDPS